MIGQGQLLDTIEQMIQNNKFPHFCILTGPKGSGKKMLARHIHQSIGGLTTVRGITVDDIRQMIQDCNKVVGTENFCLLPDADGMSIQAKNALLKITEEPPKNLYIVMTLEDINNTLDTIRSRAVIFPLEPYTSLHIQEYAESKHYKEVDIIKDICETPGEVDLLCSYDVNEFYKFVNKTVDNIAKVSGANVFKIADKLQLKDDKEGYDLKLFFKMFIRICKERYENNTAYVSGILITSQYLKDLRIKGISKQGVVDLWMLDIRREWM